MTLGFIVERNVYFKPFGPVIDMALERGHQVFCLHNYNQPRSGLKAYQFPDTNQTPKFQKGEVISLDYKTESEFIEKILSSGIQVIVSLNFLVTYLPIRNKLKEKGIFWVSLQSGFDGWPQSEEYLKYPDRFFIFSSDWLLGTFHYFKNIGKAKENNFDSFEAGLGGRVKKVGFWMANPKKLLNSDKIKQDWGIPPGKKVVLFFPFPFGSSIDKFWVKYIYGMHNIFLQLPIALISGKKRFLQQVFNQENDFKVMKAIKKFCDGNNGFLLIKSRLKDPVKKYAGKVADKILYDEEFYPSTALKCFSVADIFFSFYSTGVMEAAAMGVSNICIAPNEQDWKDIQGTQFDAMSDEKKLFSWPGISYLQTIPEIIKNLPQKTISDFAFDKKEQTNFLQKFADGNTSSASENIILEIEKMVKNPTSF